MLWIILCLLDVVKQNILSSMSIYSNYIAIYNITLMYSDSVCDTELLICPPHSELLWLAVLLIHPCEALESHSVHCSARLLTHWTLAYGYNESWPVKELKELLGKMFKIIICKVHISWSLAGSKLKFYRVATLLNQWTCMSFPVNCD